MNLNLGINRNGGNQNPQSLLTRRDVARRAAVHTETVKRWQRAGKLQAIVINSRVTRYHPDVVAKLLADATVN
jgi:predicted site-specific integrase-resolvase